MRDIRPRSLPAALRARRTLLVVLAWLAASAAVGLIAGPAYGVFLAWAGVALGAFLLNPVATMLGLLVLNVAAADWGQALILFPDKPYSINQAGLANLVMVVLTILYVLRRRPRRAPLTWPFLAFLAAGLISIAFSQSPLDGLRDWSRMAAVAGVYVVWADLMRDSPRRARTLIWTVLAASVVPAAVAIYQLATGTGHIDTGRGAELNRLIGTLNHPIGYGAFLGIVIVLVLYQWRETESAKVRVGLALWGLFSLVLLFLTYSRGPYLASLVSFAALTVFAHREIWALRGAAAALAAVLVLATAFAGSIEDLQTGYLYQQLTPVPIEAIGDVGQPAPVQRPTPADADAFRTIEGYVRLGDASVDEGVQRAVIHWSSPSIADGMVAITDPAGYYRIDIPKTFEDEVAFISVQRPGFTFEPIRYRVVLPELSEVTTLDFTAHFEGAASAPTSVPMPAIVHGVNSLSWRLNLWRFGIALAADHPITGIGLGSFPLNSPRLVGWEVTPHNDFVRVFAEMGSVGLLAYLWLWFALGRSLFALWRYAPNRGQALLGAVLISVAACYLVNGLSADLLNYPTLGWVFWSLAAVPAAFPARGDT